MKSIFEQIKQLIVDHQNDIILLIGVILISLLSFALGYIIASLPKKEPIKIESHQISTNLAQVTEIANFTNIHVVSG